MKKQAITFQDHQSIGPRIHGVYKTILEIEMLFDAKVEEGSKQIIMVRRAASTLSRLKLILDDLFARQFPEHEGPSPYYKNFTVKDLKRVK